ncbi:hypothetical protein QBC37DRAFT_401287 [Rhypophila decipiens]|uniref:Uncharacterized protein n=1 Tax=Rhypophila decipiens TaxID=261697 RepID=A0AAN7B6J4_9PEZI|nr:hypothetical protein QBC37DRAFT_401287 [Rhypophila decipiens]
MDSREYQHSESGGGQGNSHKPRKSRHKPTSKKHDNRGRKKHTDRRHRDGDRHGEVVERAILDRPPETSPGLPSRPATSYNFQDKPHQTTSPNINTVAPRIGHVDSAGTFSQYQPRTYPPQPPTWTNHASYPGYPQEPLRLLEPPQHPDHRKINPPRNDSLYSEESNYPNTTESDNPPNCPEIIPIRNPSTKIDNPELIAYVMKKDIPGPKAPKRHHVPPLNTEGNRSPYPERESRTTRETTPKSRGRETSRRNSDEVPGQLLSKSEIHHVFSASFPNYTGNSNSNDHTTTRNNNSINSSSSSSSNGGYSINRYNSGHSGSEFNSTGRSQVYPAKTEGDSMNLGNTSRQPPGGLLSPLTSTVNAPQYRSGENGGGGNYYFQETSSDRRLNRETDSRASTPMSQSQRQPRHNSRREPEEQMSDAEVNFMVERIRSIKENNSSSSKRSNNTNNSGSTAKRYTNADNGRDIIKNLPGRSIFHEITWE